MADQIKTWEKQLDEIELELAHLQWSIGRDMKLADELTAKQQEICGEIGHEWDESWGSTCVKCGAPNLRDDGEVD